MTLDLFTLYRQDRAQYTAALDERSRILLDMPVAIACEACTRYPTYWSYVMDFIQECNKDLLQMTTDNTMSLEHFSNYVAKRCKSTILDYLSRTQQIYIPPASFLRMKHRGEYDRIEWLNAHISLEILEKSDLVDIEAKTTMHRALNDAARKQIENLLTRLPEKERQAVSLHYGLDDTKLDLQDIASLLHVTPDHVRRLINAAIKRMAGEQVKQTRAEFEQNRERKTHCVNEHPLTPENIVKANRSCKICARIRVKEAYWRKKQVAG